MHLKMSRAYVYQHKPFWGALYAATYSVTSVKRFFAVHLLLLGINRDLLLGT